MECGRSMAGAPTRGRCHRLAPPSGAAGARARCAAVLAVLVAGLAVAACGSGPSVSAPAYEVQARAVAGLGEIITDGKGFTLYMYTPDHHGPSQCAGFCAQQWPPLVLPRGVVRPKAGPGVKAALLGTDRRSNGQLQETYNGWPLYLWIGDSAPGQATGQADDMGLWYAVSVTGAVDRGTPLG
jgi:predicted lipoprotein with Yx(FWY)xxD motif